MSKIYSIVIDGFRDGRKSPDAGYFLMEGDTIPDPYNPEDVSDLPDPEDLYECDLKEYEIPYVNFIAFYTPGMSDPAVGGSETDHRSWAMNKDLHDGLRVVVSKEFSGFEPEEEAIGWFCYYMRVFDSMRDWEYWEFLKENMESITKAFDSVEN